MIASCVSTELTGKYHRFGNVRMHKFPMTSFSATVYKTSSFKLSNELSNFTWHIKFRFAYVANTTCAGLIA